MRPSKPDIFDFTQSPMANIDSASAYLYMPCVRIGGRGMIFLRAGNLIMRKILA